MCAYGIGSGTGFRSVQSVVRALGGRSEEGVEGASRRVGDGYGAVSEYIALS